MKTRRLVSVLLVSMLSLTMLPAAAYGTARYSMGKDGYFGRFSLGNNHSAILDTDGTLLIVGYNNNGQLGLKNHVDQKTLNTVPDLINLCAVSLGGEHSAAITTDGSLYTWGNNLVGQLGFGDIITTNMPKKVTSLKNVTAVSLGDEHSAAITANGDLYTWGRGYNGRLGLGNALDVNTPQKVSIPNSIPNSIVAVSLGGSHSAAITADKSLYTWGANTYGQLGHGDMISVNVLKKVNALSNVVAVSLGSNHSAAVTSDGSLYTWGANNYGQLGHGDTASMDVPQKISALSNVKVIAVSLGKNHSAAITADGSLYTWGSNNYGQLGLGDTIDRKTPVKVTLSNVAAVSLGGLHSAAVLSDGQIYGWGYNYHGQLGIGNTNDRSSPHLIMKGIVPYNQVIVTVQTGNALDITTKSAVVKGNSYTVKNAKVTGTGVVWWSKNADISGGIAVQTGTASPFNIELKNLSPDTTYYYKAYVNTTVGGNKQFKSEIIKSFTTLKEPQPPRPVSSVKTMSEAYVVKGKTIKLPYAVQPYNATNQKVTWSTSDKSIATVDANGKVKGVKAGSAVITVITADGNKTASCTVNVVSKAVKQKTLKISPGSAITLHTGSMLQVKPTLSPANATGIIPTYISSNPAVAFIDKTGMIITLSPGKTTITVKAGKQEKKFTLTVGAP